MFPVLCLPVAIQRPELKVAAKPWLTVRYQFVVCADDDGNRACDFKWTDIGPMLEIANQVYAVAKVRFVCDQRSDFVHVRNSALNSIDVVSSPLADKGMVEQGKLVAKYHRKVVVLCRFGAGSRPTGTGFSGGDSYTVNLPSMRHTNAGTWILAHETGHYFGLSHTFRSKMRSVEQAEQVLKEHGGDPNVFDGDGFSDTPVDPGFSPPKGEPRDFLTLNGAKVSIPYGNIMSYMSWTGHEWMSPQQAERVRENCQIRQRVGMGWQSNELAENMLQAEDLNPSYDGGCTGEVQSMTRFNRHRWSGGAQLYCNSSVSGSTTLHFQTSKAGTIGLAAYMTLARDYGIVRFTLDGVRVGRAFDGYSRSVESSGRVSLGNQIVSAGPHELRIEAIGKNPLATGTTFGIDGITITQPESSF